MTAANLIVPSGKVVVMAIADFQDALELKNAVYKVLANQGGMDRILDAIEKDGNAGALVEAVLAVDSDKAVNEALWKCLIRCTYDHEKITVKTFEPGEAREDYYEIVSECVKMNLLPFASRLLTKFDAVRLVRKAAKIADAPKSP